MAVGLFVTPGNVLAAALSWNGGTSNDWFTAANWTPAQVPTSGDDALIDANATVLIAGAVPASFNSLVLGNAAGSTAPTLRVASTISTSGSLTVQRAAVLTLESTLLSTMGQITVAPGGQVTHASNSSARSFIVNLSVTGDFDLQSGATIAVAGKGYAGGTSSNGSGPGAGRGATGYCDSTGGGAGHGGDGGAATTRNQSPGGAGYDSVLDPTDLGSGGGASGDPGCGGGPAGGSGGGAVLLSVGNTATLNGLISADGANGGVGAGGGSGGTINIKAGTLAGNGALLANGGSSGGGGGGGAGGGRIALTASAANSFSGLVSAIAGTGGRNGGTGVSAIKAAPAVGYDVTVDGRGVAPSTNTALPSGLNGVANLSVSTANLLTASLSLSNDLHLGTRANMAVPQLTIARNLIVQGSVPASSLTGVVTVQNDVLVSSSASGSLLGTFSVQHDAILYDGSVLSASSMSVTRNMTVRTGARLRHPNNAATKQYWLNLTIGNDFDLQSGGMIDLVGVGYAGGATSNGSGPGYGAGATGYCDSTGGGAGHGGTGGAAGTRNHSAGGVAYDSPSEPVDLGSGGGAAGDPGCSNSFPGGGGGGALIMTVVHNATLNGVVTANGGDGGVGAGGGSGGTINMKADTFSGSAVVRANGGNSGGSGGGAGGGGRIAMTGCNANLAAVTVTAGTLTGSGGPGGAGTSNIIVPGACPSPPATPATIAFTAVGGASLAVAWSSASLATGYLLQVAAASDFSGTIVSSSTTGTSATVTGLLASTTYFARVQASNTFGASPFTSAISTVTRPIIDDSQNLNVPAGYTYVMAGTHTYSGSIIVNGTIQVGGLAQGASGFLFLSAASAHIFPGGRIVADAAGYGSGLGPGGGLTTVNDGTGGGGGYGGYGGINTGGLAGTSYGSLTQPQELGSGGAPGKFSGNPVVNGGKGGGRIQIDAGLLVHDGQLSANGGNGDFSGYYGRVGAGGSGGAILLNVDEFQGAGTITVNGGVGPTNFGPNASGGGGRIAAAFSTSTFSGIVTAYGGGGARSGGPGTVLWGSELRIDNNGVFGSSSTIAAGAYTFDSIILNDALVAFGAGTSINATSLTASNTVAFTADAITFAPIGAGLEVRPNSSLAFNVGATSGGSLVIGGGATFEQGSAQQLNFTSVLVQPGALLTHAPNRSTRAAVLNLNVSGDMTFPAGAAIALDGRGYAGNSPLQTGYGPGGGGTGGHGSGAGGGHGGAGGNGDGPALGGASYDSVVNPTDLGSGGGGAFSGAGAAGGGAAIIQVGGLLTLAGSISANGLTPVPETYYATGGGAGAGGSINIAAVNLTGAGTLRANGGNGTGYGGAGGGGGLIAVAVSGANSSSLSLSANNGVIVGSGNGTLPRNGGAGVIAIKTNGASSYSLTIGSASMTPQAATTISGASLAFDQVTLYNSTVAFTGGSVNIGALLSAGTVTLMGASMTAGSFLVSGPTAFTAGALTLGAGPLEIRQGGSLALDAGSVSNCNLVVRNGGVFQQANAVTLNLLSVQVDTGGQLTHARNTSVRAKVLNLNVSGDLTLQTGAKILADGLGYSGRGGSQTGAGPGGGGTGGSRNGGGGGHGGSGGAGSDGSPSGAVYDSPFYPFDLGSQGGGSSLGGGIGGGAGGGAVLLQVGGALTINGLISVDGVAGIPESYYSSGGGGGSGGTINISAASLAGSGTLRANGGSGTSRGGAGGGGGRISLSYGAKTASLTATANGGSGAGAGTVGTILDGDQLSGFSTPASAPTAAITSMQERLSDSQSISETLLAQTLDFSGGTSTGVSPGTFSQAQVQLVTLESGSFAGNGFFRGNWTLGFASGDFLSGLWQGAAFLKQSPRQMVLKGTIEGGIRGVLEGILTESVPGSGNFDRMSVACSAIQIGSQIGGSGLYFTASAPTPQTASYPGTTLNLLQSSLTGQTTGYIVGPLENTFTLLTVNSPGNPYNGEGFFLPTYSSTFGTGVGWAYAIVNYGKIARLTGILDQPLRSLLEGVLVTNAPRSQLFTLERLDVGLPVQPILSLNTTRPGIATPAALDSYLITIRNDGYAAAYDVTVVAVFPEWADFVSASGSYAVYNVASYRSTQLYSPKPFVRWDLAQIPPRSTVTMNYQSRFRLPLALGPQGHEIISGGDVRLVTKAWADTIFSVYPAGGTP